jgi:hypothetical protein
MDLPVVEKPVPTKRAITKCDRRCIKGDGFETHIVAIVATQPM